MLNNNSMLSNNFPSAESAGALPGVFSGQYIEQFYPVTSTTPLTGNMGALTSNGTVSHLAPVSTATDFTKFRRQRVASTASAGTTAALYRAYVRYARGNGYRARFNFSLITNVTGFQMFFGMSTNISIALTAAPVDLVNVVGIGFDSTDAGSSNFFVYHNDGSDTCTKVDTLVARSTATGYSFDLNCAPAGNIAWMLTNMITGDSVSGLLTTNLPTATTVVAPGMRYTNAAIASAATYETNYVGISTAG